MKAIEELRILENNKEISEATVNDSIQSIKTNSANLLLQGLLLNANITKTYSDIEVNKQSINKIASEIANNNMKTSQIANLIAIEWKRLTNQDVTTKFQTGSDAQIIRYLQALTGLATWGKQMTD